MARRRRGSRRSRRFGFRKEHGITKLLEPGSMLISFLNQVNIKDQPLTPITDPFTSLRFQVSNAVQRVSGINLSPDLVPANRPVQINLNGVVNNWTFLGLAGILYSKIPLPLPHKAAYKKVGSGFLTGGIVGGLFDDIGPSSTGMQYSTPFNPTGTNIMVVQTATGLSK